jgi:O-antigen ligase
MLFDFDTETLVYALVGAVVFHAIWLALASKLNPLLLLAGIFLLAAPFSLAMYFPGLGLVKLIRIYLTLLMVVTGLVMALRTGIGSASAAYLAFVFFFGAGALWSPNLERAVLYKGLLVALALAGVLTASTIHSLRDLRNAMRILLPFLAIWNILIVGYMVTHPSELGHRLSAYTINANGIAASSAFGLIICAYIALYDDSKFFKTAAYINGVVMATLIPFTGSRGAMGNALLGCAFVIFPVVRRPFMFFLLLLFVAGTGFGVAQFVQPEQASRLAEIDLDSRSSIWEYAINLIRERPIFGQGWDSVTDQRGEITSSNMHSMFFQTAVDAGLVGLAVFLAALVWIGLRGLYAYRLSSRVLGYTPPVCLALGLFAANVLSGIFEIGPLVGTTVNGLLFGFAIGLFDRMPAIVRHTLESAQLEQQMPAGVAIDAGYYGLEQIA